MEASISGAAKSKRVDVDREAGRRLPANLANSDKRSPSIKGGNAAGWWSESACFNPQTDVFHK